jgi:hypothetical protein
VAVGCSGSHAGSKASPVTAVDDVGEVRAQLTIGSETIGSLLWTVTPPSGVPALDAALSGTVPVGASGAAEWTLGGLPAARGYELTVTAITNDGAFDCASTTSFDVAGGQTSRTTLNLACHPVALPQGTGNVSLNVSAVVGQACTGVTSVSASPADDTDVCQSADNVIWAQTMRLVATALDSEGNTSDQYIEYAWSVSPFIGTFDDVTSSTPVFTCVEALSGVAAEMTVTTSAPGAPTCGQGAVFTFPVSCLPPPCDPSTFTCDCHVCADLASDDANCGACGSACPSGSVCSQGVCVAGEAGADVE